MKKISIFLFLISSIFIFSACKFAFNNNKTSIDLTQNQAEISVDKNKDDYWNKIIKKSEILDIKYKNEISLTNISNIEPIYKDEKISLLKIGNKYFDFSLLAKEFQLESSNIEKIEIDKNNIIVYGKND